jgi:hypothetical protein
MAFSKKSEVTPKKGKDDPEKTHVSHQQVCCDDPSCLSFLNAISTVFKKMINHDSDWIGE